MRAYRVEETGSGDSPPRTALREIEAPRPGPGEVAIAVAACGLNFADLLMMQGRYQDTPPTPFTLGMEIAGVVTALGPGVTAPAVGARVCAFLGQGGLAEHCLADAARCVVVPDALDMSAAAGLQIAYGTSHLALTERARLRAGERLLVLGAGGGVGLTAVEIGAMLGAEVIAVARGADKLDAAREAGAHHLLDARDADLKAEVKALGGADVVYDAVGGDAFTAALGATRPGGRILLIGFASGDLPEIKPNHLLVKNVDVMGVYWGGYLRFAPDILTGSLAEVMAHVADGTLRPKVGATYPLSDTETALEALRSRAVPGKIVVTMP